MTAPHEREALAGPIWRTFVRYLIPSLVGILSMTSATLVDGIFVGNFVGARALAVTNLINPLLNLVFGLCLTLAIGGSVRAGKYLGENDVAAASGIFSKSLIAIASYATLAVALAMAFHRTLYRALGATEELFPLMDEYYLVVVPFLIPQLVMVVLYFFVRLDGYPKLAAAALVIGSALNVALDYLLIVSFEWGLRGAALATGFSQSLPLLVLLAYFVSPRRHLRFSAAQGNWKELLQAAYNGISDFINEVSAGVIAFIFNWMLMLRAGVEGVAAISVVNYLMMIGLMLFFSIGDTNQVMVSQNFGARSAERIRRFHRVAAGLASVVGLLCIVGLVFFSRPLVGMFLADEGSQRTAELATRFLHYNL